ncbi:MAG TPA: YiiD C-terminal domain-containing protein [Actinomycetota bacterium]|nr:YiiD C-terminal domain-containing protein [Actinomycetota bacterium]
MADSAGVPSPGEVENVVRAMVPALAFIGIEVAEVGHGHVRTRLPHAAQNGNHIGTVYAGVLFSFLEATGGALVLVSFDVARYVPVIVEGTIRYARPVTSAIECDLAMTTDEIDAVHHMLEDDRKASWTLVASAHAEDGTLACEADLVYRFRTPR